jgi:hypothetical protein
MRDAVHLEALRCDGGAHDGCQAACLLFWKEAWLRRVQVDVLHPSSAASLSDHHIGQHGLPTTRRAACTDECLVQAARRLSASDPRDVTYTCQATELNKATTPLRWWDVRQYVRELQSGNIGFSEFIRILALAAFNVVTRRLGGKPYPCIRGALAQTPATRLNLMPGDTVQVKSKKEIEATLDTSNRNRGLYFDREMVRYCGGQFKVLARVEQIINEKNGKMIRLPNGCVVLAGVTCRGDVSTNRLFCPRSINPYWRDIWLTRTGLTKS